MKIETEGGEGRGKKEEGTGREKGRGKKNEPGRGKKEQGSRRGTRRRPERRPGGKMRPRLADCPLERENAQRAPKRSANSPVW